MKQLYSLLILLSAAFIAKAQPTLPAAPAACNANNCTTNANIDVCAQASNTVVTTTQNAVYNRGNNGNNLGVNAVWRYRNIATVAGVTVNAELTIDAISNATLVALDDDLATDQGGNSIASFFAPRIGADQVLNGTDRRGYVQFTMTFFRNATGVNNNTNADFATSISLANINYVHYDIDGNDANNVTTGTAGSWFRETGLAKRVTANNPIVTANNPTELVAYGYTDPVTTSWTGFAGTICERTGVSRCAQTTAAFSYSGVQSSMSFRMGYDYNGGGNIGQPVRQYGSRLGCFNFPALSTLPVRLLNLSASFKNKQTTLNWSASDEVNFEKFVVERSADGRSFTAIAEKAATGSIGIHNYESKDDLSAVQGAVFYYRLKMVDQDGKFGYSYVVAVKKEEKGINGISINPNPISNGIASVRFASSGAAYIDIRVVDMAGKVVLQQHNKVYDGINSVTINRLDKLVPGIYTLQMIKDAELSVMKFSVIR
jgi:hypothetical protein